MSRNPERIDLILGEIRRIWNDNPDLRLAQLVFDAIPRAWIGDPYYAEDDVLLAGLLNYGKEGN